MMLFNLFQKIKDEFSSSASGISINKYEKVKSLTNSSEEKLKEYGKLYQEGIITKEELYELLKGMKNVMEIELTKVSGISIIETNKVVSNVVESLFKEITDGNSSNLSY